MIYLVTNQQRLFADNDYTVISVEESLQMMSSWTLLQLDTETTGRDPHLCELLCVQFGNDKADARIIVDTSTVKIELYKDILEQKFCILQNGKFDLQFFFKHGIIIRKVYDTMIVEQLLHLGWPAGQMSYSLNAIARRRLDTDIDKSVRGEIQWRGLDTTVIRYAAGDVTYLEKIMHAQLTDLKKWNLMKAAQIECGFVPVIAYLEWCGIHLDQDRWKAKMQTDRDRLNAAKDALDQFLIHEAESNSLLQKYIKIDTQGDLFLGYDLSPKVTVNWSSSRQVVAVAKALGFDTTTQDKKTGEDKESVLEKHLQKQKGINDEFLKVYFSYQKAMCIHVFSSIISTGWMGSSLLCLRMNVHSFMVSASVACLMSAARPWR